MPATMKPTTKQLFIFNAQLFIFKLAVRLVFTKRQRRNIFNHLRLTFCYQPKGDKAGTTFFVYMYRLLVK